MSKITCEMCGSLNIIKENGLYTCQSCGTKYSPDEAKKLMAVNNEVRNNESLNQSNSNQNIKNLENLSKRALDSLQFDELYKYSDKILELDPNNYGAVFNKGLARAWQSNLINVRITDVVLASKDALNIIENQKLHVDIEKIKLDHAKKILPTVVTINNMAVEYYDKFQDHKDVIDTFWMVLRLSIEAYEYSFSLLGENASNNSLKIQILENLITASGDLLKTRHYEEIKFNRVNYEKYLLDANLRNIYITKLQEYNVLIQKLDSRYVPKKQDPEKQGGCYIATSVYGSYDSQELWTLRRFRDENLSKLLFGRIFIKLYYYFSPKLVKLFGNIVWLKNLFKWLLDRLVLKLQEKGVESNYYVDSDEE